jgi:hypothetical protein
MRTPEIRPSHCHHRVNDSIKDQGLNDLDPRTKAFLVVELKNRIAANEIWIKGSHTYRAFDEHMISQQTYAVIKAEARIPVAIPVDVEVYLAQKAEALDQKLREAARRLESGRGDTRIGAKACGSRRSGQLKPRPRSHLQSVWRLPCRRSG